jgi:hypothetical protein
MSRDTQPDLYGQATGWLTNTARRNPEGMLLLAAGCALLLRGGSGRTGGDAFRNSSTPSASSYAERGRESFSRAADEASDYASDLKDKASDLKAKVSDTASDYARSASDYAGETTRKVSERSQEFARQAQSTIESTMGRVLREQPLAIAMLGLAAGAAVAAAFPTTAIEKSTLGAAGEAMADAAEKAKDSVMEATGKAGERLKTAAEERGLNAEGLKNLAGEVTDAFKESMSGKGEKHTAPTTVPEPGTSGLESRPSSPAGDRAAGVRSADIAGAGPTRGGGGSNR